MEGLQPKLTQTDLILNYLKQGYTITPLEALQKWGCFRLGARCWDLRRQGYNIQMTMIKNNGKHFAQYFLAKEEKQLVMSI